MASRATPEVQQSSAGSEGVAAAAGGLARRLAALVRDPFVLFLLLATLLFAAHATLADRDPVVITAELEAALAEERQALSGRAPTAEERARLVRDHVADELLFREAVARGYHLTDGAVRRRLVDRMRFEIGGIPRDPSEEELVAHYAANIARYRSEPRIAFEHVFFARPPAEPAVVLARLRAGETVTGDDFWMGRRFPPYGESMILGMFGPDFLRILATAPQGEWVGPVSSPRGTHFVRRFESVPPSRLAYPDVREQVLLDLLAEEAQRAVDAEVEKLARVHGVRDAR